MVGPAGGWSCAKTVGLAAIGRSSPRTTSDGLGVDEGDSVATLGIVEIEGVAVAVELQVDVVGCPGGVIVVEPEHGIAMGRDTRGVVDAGFARQVGIVAEETAGDIDVGRSGVVELDPAAVVERRIEPLVDVGAAKLVDDQGFGLGEDAYIIYR